MINAVVVINSDTTYLEDKFTSLGIKVFAFDQYCHNNLDKIQDIAYLESFINNILIDFSQDMWRYISDDWLSQKTVKGEIGSSTMPQKINPIDFENAEGNLGFANAMFEHLSAKLPVSRLQRDLTDSTVLRNIGMPFAHTLIALASIEKGLGKLILNEDKLMADLDNHWEVCAEAIQTVLRREGYEKPYEALKALTRGSAKVTPESLAVFIDGLKVSDSVKIELKNITPHNYTGIDLV